MTGSASLNRETNRFGSPAALWFLLASFVFRLVYGANAGLANDETYYWQWSRHPALSYFDQGPGIAWCVRGGTALFGNNPLGIRFVGIVLGTLTGYLVYLTVRRWFTPQAEQNTVANESIVRGLSTAAPGELPAFLSLVLLSVAPLLFVGGIIATYDGPQVFSWAAALYALTRTLRDDKPIGWYAVGAFVGLGLLCKLTTSFFAPAVLVFLLLSPTYRRHLATPHPYLGLVVAALVFLPVVLWSQQNGWTSVLHAQALTNRGKGAALGRWTGDFLGGQALVVGPLLFLAELWGFARLVRFLQGRSKDASLTAERARFLVCFTGAVLLVCAYTSLKSKLEANWAAPMHVAGLMGAGIWLAEAWQKGRARAAILASVGLSALLTGVLLFPQVLPFLGVRVSSNLAQKANETYGWSEVVAGVQKARTSLEAEGKPVFLAGTNYRVPSLLAYFLPDHPETQELFLSARHDQYWFWTKPETLIGQNALLCVDDPKPQALAQARLYFDSVEELPRVQVFRPGFDGAVKTWELYACRNFHGYNPQAHVEGY